MTFGMGSHGPFRTKHAAQQLFWGRYPHPQAPKLSRIAGGGHPSFSRRI